MKEPDWNHIRAFHATAETGSLSAAARKIGLTQPTLSRQVVALEAELGVTLFERIGRRLVLTQTGLDLLEHVRAMGAAATSVALSAGGRSQEVSGRVNISATDTYAAYVLPAIVERIVAEAPQITVAIISANSFSDLHRREADIAIRHVRPEQPGLIGRHLGDTSAHFYASRDWVARNGMPAIPSDLARAGIIGFDDTERYANYLRDINIPVTAGHFRLVSENSVVVWEMVKRGMGVAAMVREVADATPGIVRLLPDIDPISVPVWLVSHRELHTSRRIRTVHDILAEELGRILQAA
jgi:DNA-binding transcriptional LysR family regulator